MQVHPLLKSFAAGLAGTAAHLVLMLLKDRLGLLPQFQPYQEFQRGLSMLVGAELPPAVAIALSFVNGALVWGFIFGRAFPYLPGRGPLAKGEKLGVQTGPITDNSGKQVLEAKNIILATGGRARQLPSMPIDGKKIIGYREAMVLPSQPKSMIICGSGAIGSEFAYFYNSMGTKVTIVEFMPNIVPVEDEEISKELAIMQPISPKTSSMLLPGGIFGMAGNINSLK
mgnify:CR=1 FL=1